MTRCESYDSILNLQIRRRPVGSENEQGVRRFLTPKALKLLK